MKRRGSVRIVTAITLPTLLVGCMRPTPAMLDRIVIGEVMMHSEFAENLREICLPGGRLSGTANSHVAGRIVADKLREYGLKNVHFEAFDMPGWQVRETHVTALTDPPMELVGAVALWNTESTPPGGIEAELYDVGEGTTEDFDQTGDALRGKFALVREGGGTRSNKMLEALKRGAAGMVVVGRPDREPVIGSCHPQPRPEPGIVVRNEDGEKLAELLKAGEAVRLNVKVRADLWDARPENVVADIPGSGPYAREMVIVGAHLDSWHLGQGGIDNGNGSAAILESARALAAIDWKPRRTIRFVWFMGEEQGLFGSDAYVAAHLDEMDDVVAMINADMPGAPRSFGMFGHPEIVDFLKTAAADLRGYEISDKIGNHRGGFSDHAAFMNAGVCAIAVWGDLGDGVRHYHTTGDHYDAVDRDKTIQSSAVIGVLVRRLADMPTRLTSRHEPRD